MAIYRQVHTSFWQDPEMIEYEPEEKYFYIYLMTNPHTTQCGIYEISPRLISIELGYPIDTVWELLKKFVDRGKILYSEETREVFLLNWLKYNSLKSPKVMSCVEKELQEVKYKPFLKKFYDLCIQYKYPIDTLSIDLGEEQEEEQKEKEEQKQQQNKSSSDSSIELKKQNDVSLVAKEFEKNGFGTITLTIKEMLIDLLDEYSTEWIIQAMKVAVKNNKRKLSYVEGILQNWKRAGGMKLGGEGEKDGCYNKNNSAHSTKFKFDKSKFLWNG